MRIGELKNILSDAIDESNSLIFIREQLYGGDRYRISNYDKLITALNVLIKQSWVNVDVEVVKELINYNYSESFEVSGDVINRLDEVISNINIFLPVFYSMLEQFAPKQEEQIINIKIPSNYTSDIGKLNEFNQKLEKVFKLVALNKGFGAEKIELQGFDTGTNWYKVLLVGTSLAYGGVFGMFEIANERMQLRKNFYESEIARTHYEVLEEKMAKKETEEFTKESYADEFIELKTKKEISKLIESMGDEIKTPCEEMLNSLLLGLPHIINLMEEGTEFHPSLNPPDFIETDKSTATFKINYDSLRKCLSENKAKEKIKQIEDKSGGEPTE